jgi:hypothetical protein
VTCIHEREVLYIILHSEEKRQIAEIRKLLGIIQYFIRVDEHHCYSSVLACVDIELPSFLSCYVELHGSVQRLDTLPTTRSPQV